MSQIRGLAFSTAVFVLLLAAGLFYTKSLEDHRTQERRSLIRNLGTAQAQSIERQLFRSVSAAFALALLLRENGKIEDFDSLAATVLEMHRPIDHLSLAPNGVVRQIYPLKGHEKALGHDLLNDPLRRTEALAAIRSKKLTLAGPFKLIQGDVGVIGRFPVFLPDGAGGERFWGFTIVLIKLNTLLEATNFGRLVENDLEYKLWRIHPDTRKPTVFAQSSTSISQEPESFRIAVPNGTWHLSLAPKGGWKYSSSFGLEVGLVASIGLLFAGLTYAFLRQPEVLRILVKTRTQELLKSNDDLKAEIVERQRAEQALRASEERFRQLAENIRQIFWLTSADGKLPIYVSPAYETICGRPCRIWYDQPSSWANSIHPEDRERFLAAAPKRWEGTFDEEYRIIRPDGSTRWIRGRAFPIKNELGEVYRIAGISDDVTEQKRLEEKLHQSRKLDALGRLASGVAHDFNNVLNLILGHVGLIKKSSLAPQIHRDLDSIEKAALSGSKTVKRMQNFARKREDRPKGVVDLNDVIRDVAEMTRPRWKNEAEKEGVTFDVKVETRAAHGIVQGEAAELQEALINLVNNSLDAMPQGGTLTLLSENRADEVCVTIADTGKGMTREERDQAFEPFFTTKGANGTGLGLSMVFGIVERYGGRIEMESRPGKGTSMRLVIPPGKKQSNEVQELGALASPPGRILVIDDDEDIAELLGRMLEEAHHHVTATADPHDGLEKFKNGSFDLVLTDLGMPTLSGWDIAKSVKEINPETAVVLLTGWGGEIEEDGLSQNGVDRIMSKPVQIPQLLNLISEVLLKKEATPQ